MAREYETGPIRPRNDTAAFDVLPGFRANEAPFGWSPLPTTGIDGMFFGGHTATSRDSSQLSSTTLKFDLTSQVNFNHLVKTGLELIYSDLDLN